MPPRRVGGQPLHPIYPLEANSWLPEKPDTRGSSSLSQRAAMPCPWRPRAERGDFDRALGAAAVTNRVRYRAAALVADEDIERRFLSVLRLWGGRPRGGHHELDLPEFRESGYAHARYSRSTAD